ncbi:MULTISPECIES: hypothetical protein [unclassified Pseudoxanthomonas]|uniref:hypothetical protein n=1 Tax=unclassified Pseudoxanthomonas TaxID=2645906 RepID=UPI0030775428
MNTQKRSPWAFLVGGAIAAVGALAVGSPPSAAQESGSVITPVPPMNTLSVEPRVPRLGITPCVVELFRGLVIDNYVVEGDFDTFEYVPPAGCPGPWAKVILSVDLSSPEDNIPPYYAALDNIMISLGDESRDPERAIELMMATPQINEGAATWRVERDVTDYSSLFYVPRIGFAINTDNYYRFPCVICASAVATGRLIFYPATAIQPAPDVPDAIYSGGYGWTFPRNIERVYVDMYLQPYSTNWFSCVPRSAVADYPILLSTPVAIGDNYDPSEENAQGCQGATYRDVLVTVDAQPAGAATLYPWLNSNLNIRFPHSVDIPVSTPQSINLMPVRVDITPFAALLSDGTTHGIGAIENYVDFLAQGPSRWSQMLVYLDHGSQQITGAVTTNTLATGAPWAPMPIESTEVRNEWQQEGDVLHGNVENHYRRQYEVAGYVNTSHGRIDSRVKHEHVLTNVQLVRVEDMSNFEHHTYAQNLDFVSTTTRSSVRQQGTKVLSLDKDRYHYPLKIDYQATGGVVTTDDRLSYIERARTSVIQGQHQQRAFYRPEGTYANRLYANFAGSRSYNALTGTSSNWYGARSHYFNDSAGSCFRERVTWLSATLTSHTQGESCPNGYNYVRGFAHPDGSPESLGWLR